MRSETTSARAGAQPVHPHNTLENRPKVAAFGVVFTASRLGAIAALDHLAAIEDDLTNGRTVSARESVTNAIGAIEDGGREDFSIGLELIDLPPLWEIDSTLHTRRDKVLSHYLPAGIMGKDGVFRDVDPEIDREFIVHPNDVWIASTGTNGWRANGAGLTSLIDFVTGKGLANVAANLARKLHVGSHQ